MSNKKWYRICFFDIEANDYISTEVEAIDPIEAYKKGKEAIMTNLPFSEEEIIFNHLTVIGD